MHIGELARATGVSVDTVRYYERLGLVEALGRTPGGFRLFDETDVGRIGEIRALQSLGLTLDQIGALFVEGDYSCAATVAALDGVAAKLDDALARLHDMKARVHAASMACCSGSCGLQAEHPLSCT